MQMVENVYNVIQLQWLTNVCLQTLYTQFLLQEGHGKWETIEELLKLLLVYIQQTQLSVANKPLTLAVLMPCYTS